MLKVPATPVLSAAVTADVDALVAADGQLRLMGYSVAETAGAIAYLKIVNGATGAAVGKVALIKLAAAASETRWLGDDGIACPLGLSLDWISGTMDVVLFYKKGEV